MNRTIIGLDLDKEFSQISFYSERNAQPETVSITEEGNQYLIPTPPDLFKEIGNAMELGVVSLSNFLKSCIATIRTATDMGEVCMMVTVKEVDQAIKAAVLGAAEMLGMKREHVWLQTHRESFFCYTLNQKRDLWAQKVALFEYEEEKISSYVLQVDYATRPALATVSKGEVLRLGAKGHLTDDEWNRKRDQKFLELIGRTFEGNVFSSIFLIGDHFDKTWAVDSLSFLCRRRHVFQGRNLYTKGACYAACARLGVGVGLSEYLYRSEDMVETNISMQMMVRGKEVEYSLIGAGCNWFDAEHVCEFLLDDTKEVELFGKSMFGGETASYTIELKKLPVRPPRTTRLQLKAAFTAADKCKITIKDLGFGEFFPSSGLAWESTLDVSERR